MITFLGLIAIVVTLMFGFLNAMGLYAVWQYLIPAINIAPHMMQIASWYLLFMLGLSILVTVIYIVVLIAYWISLHWKHDVNVKIDKKLF